MPRTLPKSEPDDGADFVQFRGPQTSVTHDPTGIRFGTRRRQGRIVHEAVPVVDIDDPDPPERAVARPVAEQLVEQNPLVCWGVVCEHPVNGGDVCGCVFNSPQGLNSHLSVHADDGGADGDD
jgi:hypothetical protein